MMKIPKFYFDTPVFNFALADDVPAERVSWNFTHIVKLKTRREVAVINTLMGYKPIDICSPQEVIENG